MIERMLEFIVGTMIAVCLLTWFALFTIGPALVLVALFRLAF